MEIKKSGRNRGDQRPEGAGAVAPYVDQCWILSRLYLY